MKHPPADARTLSPETQDYLRQRALYLRQKGESIEVIATFLGVHRDTVSRWWQQYQQQGESALRQQQRGRKAGDGSRLTTAQSEAVQQWLRDYYPDKFGIESTLWTRRALQTLIQQQYGLEIPLRTLSDYLHRWGFSPKKPLQRSQKQNQFAVQEWILQEFSAIERQAMQEEAEIHWGDEANAWNGGGLDRDLAAVGDIPESRLHPQQTQVNYISAISAQGTVRFKLYQGGIQAENWIEFLERLIAGTRRKIFLILGHHLLNWAEAAQVWFDQHEAQLEVFYLPPEPLAEQFC
jgi:transposase